jgi:rhombotail lipoprotein
MDLLRKMDANFNAYPFVKSIEVFSSAYLSPNGGLANLDQLRTMCVTIKKRLLTSSPT